MGENKRRLDCLEQRYVSLNTRLEALEDYIYKTLVKEVLPQKTMYRAKTSTKGETKDTSLILVLEALLKYLKLEVYDVEAQRQIFVVKEINQK